MLKAIKAAAGSVMANSSVRSVLVRSVNRHFFLDILSLACVVPSPYEDKTITTRQRECVKTPQRIVKSCKALGGPDAIMTARRHMETTYFQ
jgi:hypothetical protein